VTSVLPTEFDRAALVSPKAPEISMPLDIIVANSVANEDSPANHVVRVDWLGLRFDVSDGEQSEIVPALVSWKLDPDATKQYGLLPPGPNLRAGCEVAFQALPPDGKGGWTAKAAASVRVKKGKKTGKHAIFLDIHPPGLTGTGVEHVWGFVVGSILNRSAEEIANAQVQRLDIALDLPGVVLGGYAWGLSGYRTRAANVLEPTLRSLRLGSTKHGSLSAYDKTGKAKGSPPATRVEARLRPHCPVAGLLGLDAIFERLVVRDVKSALASIGRSEVEREAMLALAQLRGLKAMFNAYPPGGPDPLRPKVQAAVAKAVPSWWKGKVDVGALQVALLEACPPLAAVAAETSAAQDF
jgi:hypothetical protein